ncbi:MAG: GGDEF domain-containing protein [Acidobacteria bacterium]|nr:GGDEF domain-containing protein [Acidobacteriota bacterium]
MTDRPISLGLSQDDATDGANQRDALLGVVEDLVVLLEAQFPAAPEFPSEALRTRLMQARERLRGSGPAKEVSNAGLRLVGDASQAYARLAGHVSAREAEFGGVIRLLRELVDGLRGDAAAFRQDLMASSTRVADLTRIEDIRTLRRELNREVDQLRHSVKQVERQEASRLAQVATDLKRADETLAQATATRESSSSADTLTRAALLRDMAMSPLGPASVVVCRVDEPKAIVDGHGLVVFERVVLALGQLLRGTFGDDAKVYRTDTHHVAMFLPGAQPKQVAQVIRKVQARVAAEYEYERQGVTRRVVFTFSAAVSHTHGKGNDEALDALARAERQASEMHGLAQLEAESSGFGRLVNWLSSAG